MGVFSETTFTPDRLIAGSEADLVTDHVTILSGEGVLARGSAIGKVLFGAVTSVAGGGNVGNPTFPAFVRGIGVKVGAYLLTVTVLAGTKIKGATAHTGTGNGVLTYTSISQNAKVGNYVATCTAAAANGGTFIVRDPDNIDVGQLAVGVAFDNGLIQVTVADGAADWVVGDTVTFPVAWSTDTSKFSVTDPKGMRLADGFVGTAYAQQLGFTLTAGATHVALGDTWTVTVAAGSLKYRLVDNSHTDGSGIAWRILANATDATSADAVSVAYANGMFNSDAVIFGGADVAANHVDELEAIKIFLVDSVHAV